MRTHECFVAHTFLISDPNETTAAWTLSVGILARKRRGAWRKRWENNSSETKIPSFLCEWKQADGEFSEEGIDRKRGRDERLKK